MPSASVPIVHPGRLGVRPTRRRVLRGRRMDDDLALAAGELVLTPAEPADVPAWDALLDRPPAEGLAASSLGGAAHTPRQWVHRLHALRAAGDRAYLVRVDGELGGEALVFLDRLGGFDRTSALAELVVWLAEPWTDRLADVVELLSRDLLDTGTARRVLITVGSERDAATLVRVGFVREGAFSDPPFPDRPVLVRHGVERSR